MPHRFLPAEQIVERLRSSDAPLVVLTGGEPFEHPEFDRLVELIECEMARKSLAPFRIATGGHIAFSGSLLERLKRIPSFTGVSLGTDVLTEACPTRAEYSLTWNQNVQLLNRLGVPYSLTLTLHEALNMAFPNGSTGDLQYSQSDFEKFNPLMRAKDLGACPEYLYLRTSASDAASEEFYDEIRSEFRDIRVLFDRF